MYPPDQVHIAYSEYEADLCVMSTEEKRERMLSAYLYDGNLQIDNNLVENAIRPIALGRKNYLFAGSHEAAQRSAMIYSFFAICKKHEVNPHQWLKYTLENIMSINHKNLKDLYPQNFKNNLQESNT
nr:transposase [Sphingobacterium sp. T2]